jgi:hypothetical protein
MPISRRFMLGDLCEAVSVFHSFVHRPGTISRGSSLVIVKHASIYILQRENLYNIIYLWIAENLIRGGSVQRGSSLGSSLESGILKPTAA